jgi:hypothetical protein
MLVQILQTCGKPVDHARGDRVAIVKSHQETASGWAAKDVI